MKEVVDFGLFTLALAAAASIAGQSIARDAVERATRSLEYVSPKLVAATTTTITDATASRASANHRLGHNGCRLTVCAYREN
jgi:hypothetical protein